MTSKKTKTKKVSKNPGSTFIILSEDGLEASGLDFNTATTKAKDLLEKESKTDVKILQVVGVWLVYHPEEPAPIISRVASDELDISI